MDMYFQIAKDQFLSWVLNKAILYESMNWELGERFSSADNYKQLQIKNTPERRAREAKSSFLVLLQALKAPQFRNPVLPLTAHVPWSLWCFVKLLF